MKIRYYDEADLQRKIVKILNERGYKQGYHFKKAPSPYFCDLVDDINKIYVEVKPEYFAPAQILYGIAKTGKILDVEYVGLACAFEIRFYKPPSKTITERFAKKIDPTLNISPSQVNKKEWHEEAFKLLGDHWHIYTYDKELKIDNSTNIFIDEGNYAYFKKLFKKYEIDPSSFLPFLTDVHAKNDEIYVSDKGRISNQDTEEFFRNVKGSSEKGYKSIKDFRDRSLFKFMRIRANDIQKILKQVDRLEPITIRRSTGRFFTKTEISKEMLDIVKGIDPDYIVEPYVGAGSLISLLVKSYDGVANDINKLPVDALRKKFSKWKFTNINTITTNTDDLIRLWEIPKDKIILILTNPPFGTVATNILASKKGEIKNGKKSRKIKIDYADLGDKYGRGDLVLPAVGKLIEIIKKLRGGYLATFTPAGAMYGISRFKKLLGALLRDFEFIKGYVFGGENFNGVASKKSIAFTIWKYHKNINTDINSLEFMADNKFIKLKQMTLLKEGWAYDTRNVIKGEIGVQHNETFNVPAPKIFHIKVRKGGSELIPENVKINLNVPNIPSELVYGLWSTCVGYKSITNFPTYINEAYTHLPDFSRKETMEILTYALIYALISELKKNYCEGKIGFDRMSETFKFGGERLTNGAKYLIDTYGYCKIGAKTITEVFNELMKEPDINKLNENYRTLIKSRIEKRLELIKYWDYIPIPK